MISNFEIDELVFAAQQHAREDSGGQRENGVLPKEA